MINAKELRIGNLVYFNGNHNEIGVLSEIIKNGVTKFTPYKIGINNRIDIYYEIDKLKPIPLTEEWLFKLGFINDKVLEFYRNDFTDSTIIIDYNLICLLGYSHVKLKYVHQLQNLYFALTNEELTLKL